MSNMWKGMRPLSILALAFAITFAMACTKEVEVEVIKEVPVEVVKEVEVEKVVTQEVEVEVIKEVIKEVQVEVAAEAVAALSGNTRPAVADTAVLPNVSFPSGTISPAAPPNIKSSAEVSHSIYALAVSPNNFTSYP